MFLFALLLAALVWYPASKECAVPDPIASVHARKGGTIRFAGGQPPKSTNGYVDNNTYTAMTFSLMYDQLLRTDPVTLEFVPALARRWAVSDDGQTFVFEIDPAARWSDGKPVTAEDVQWTFDAVMAPKNDTGPWKMMLGVFERPVVESPSRVRFHKKAGADKDWRDLMTCGMFWILPRHALAQRDFNAIDFQGVPVCGPYRLGKVREQIETEYVRDPAWWRRDHPAFRHVYNFDRILLRYYVDNENAFEALKKRQIDFYPVYTARIMAAETYGEKFDHNWILKRRVKNHNPVGFQGFAMNMRRAPFDDRRVRKAMAHLIDRETMNRTMMYDEYFLLKSIATDLYDAATPCTNDPCAYAPETAKCLLAEAGWRRAAPTATLVKDGKPFRFTFLSRSTTEDKFLALFTHALADCGIQVDIVRKDFAAWMRDMDAFNYDMTWAAWGASVFRTPEPMWLSSEADRTGANNITGFKSAEVDRLIRAEKGMATMAERRAAYRRMDACIMAEAPYALLWNIAETRLLYWNKFGMPQTILGKYASESSALMYWWYDADRAHELAQAIASHGFLPSVPERVDFDRQMAENED